MRINAALLLLAACSAESRPDAATNTEQTKAIGVESFARDNQSPGDIGQSKPGTDAAAAKIMAGGFLPDGSFVHGDHIHKPGQENCPSDMSGGPVQ